MSIQSRKSSASLLSLLSASVLIPLSSALAVSNDLLPRKTGTVVAAGAKVATKLTTVQIVIIVVSIVVFIILCIVAYYLWKRHVAKKSQKAAGSAHNDKREMKEEEINLVDREQVGQNRGIGDARSSYTEEAYERRDREMEAEEERLMAADDTHDQGVGHHNGKATGMMGGQK